MDITVHGKQMEVGDALTTHVNDKIAELNEKYFNHGTFSTITFSREGHGHKQTKAHISLKMGKNIMIVADVIADEPYAAFDKAAEKISKQLRRYKRKLRDHHERQEQTPESEISKATGYVLAAQELDELPKDDNGHHEHDDLGEPVIIAEMPSAIETMSLSDAVMRLDLSGDNALVFRSQKHGGLNVVYRRKDGNLGWIDPENIPLQKAS